MAFEGIWEDYFAIGSECKRFRRLFSYRGFEKLFVPL
jgi:hypothetical protein